MPSAVECDKVPGLFIIVRSRVVLICDPTPAGLTTPTWTIYIERVNRLENGGFVVLNRVLVTVMTKWRPILYKPRVIELYNPLLELPTGQLVPALCFYNSNTNDYNYKVSPWSYESVSSVIVGSFYVHKERPCNIFYF